MTETKYCSSCSKHLPLGNFYKMKLKLRGQCKSCVLKKQKQWVKTHPEKRKEHCRRSKSKKKLELSEKEYKTLRWRSSIKYRYKIDANVYQQMLVNQQNVCDICKQEPFAEERLVIDHCHITKNIRGLLCSRCNSCLERLERISGWESKAREYLNKFAHQEQKIAM